MSNSASLESLVSEEPRLDSTTGTSGAAYPGKRSRTQSIGPSIDSLADRVATVLQRRAASDGGGGRDGNGVAEDADSAVNAAAGASGSPLRGDVRDRFERSLGADLSSVRVHTGESSAQASAAVGARAYTVGNDIHFSAGAYQPDDPFGLHLLAHEVAHTQQQAGGSPHRQNKLEVSAPGDTAEHEADRAADAMVRGEAAAVSFGSGVQRLIQRDADPAAKAAPAASPGTYRLSSDRMPLKFNLLDGNATGLEAEVLRTNAFKGVPPEDPMFSTITQFCSPDAWDRPNQAKSTNVSTQQWGMKGAWTIKVTPSLFAAVHLGGAGKIKVSTAGSTSVASGGTTSTGSEAGVEHGGASAKATQGTGTSHGGGYTGGGGAEGEYESQRFSVTLQFAIEISGGWTEGTAASALRVGTAITTFGLSELGRAGGEAVAPVQRTWAASHKAGYLIEVPTDVCAKI